MKNKRKSIKVAAILLCVAGLSILAAQFYGDLYSMYKQRLLHKEWNAGRTSTTHIKNTPPSTPLPPCSTERTTTGEKRPSATSTTQPPAPAKHQKVKLGSAFARIVIPKIKVDAIVVEGVEQTQLALGPGHMEETAWPGEYGNMVVSGHRVTHSRPFFRLDELKVGDPITIYTKSQQFTYNVVEKKVVKPTDLSVIKPTKNRILTLTTCNPPYSAKTRLIIHARMY